MVGKLHNTLRMPFCIRYLDVIVLNLRTFILAYIVFDVLFSTVAMLRAPTEMLWWSDAVANICLL